MRRLLVLPLAVLALAGCGGSKSVPTPKAKAAADPAAAMRALAAGLPARTLYRGGSWAVVEAHRGRRAEAFAFRLVGSRWRADRSGRVKVRILGPDQGSTAARIPQVAAELIAPTRLAESALWVDGVELLEKGGGSPTRGTIYGAPREPLAPGWHVAVAYARTATAGTAVAWTFRV